MAYKILKKLITDKTKTAGDLLNMADVYYAAGRLTDEQFSEVVDLIASSTE